MQGLEGNLDTAHISFLHRDLADFAVRPDDTDAPGYPSDADDDRDPRRRPGAGARDAGHVVRLPLRRPARDA